MASVRFERVPNPGMRGAKFRATFDSMGRDLPRGPQMTSREAMELRMVPRPFVVPRGVDRDAPRSRG